MKSKAIATATFAIICLAFPLFAHEDDPKILDQQPAYSGRGYRPGIDLQPGMVFPSTGVHLLSWLTVGDFGANMTRANDCWGYVAPSGREYALIGLSHGTGFVEITAACNPKIVEVLAGPSSTWRDIKVYGAYAYAVSEGGQGIQVFDLTQIDSGIVTLANTVTVGGPTSTHNVAIDEVSGFLYRCGGSGNGLRIYSLANPTAPELVGSWPDRYVHDAQVVTYTEGPYTGRQVAFCFGGFNQGYVTPGVSILDVTDKANIVDLAHYQYANPSYTHQGWLSEDRQYLYVNDELDERNQDVTTTTHVLDVGDLENPFEAGTFTNGSTAIDHNVYVRGNLLFEANYRSGLRVFDATDPVAPVEIGHFDTYPENDNDSFNGLWSSYPYFPSGTVIGSDIEKGLFIWTLGNAADINGDGQVDGQDLMGVLPEWRDCHTECDGDLNGNPGVDTNDLVMILNGSDCPSSL